MWIQKECSSASIYKALLKMIGPHTFVVNYEASTKMQDTRKRTKGTIDAGELEK